VSAQFWNINDHQGTPFKPNLLASLTLLAEVGWATAHQRLAVSHLSPAMEGKLAAKTDWLVKKLAQWC